MVITELVELSSSRVKVYLDEQFAFVLYKGELRKYGIKAGQPLVQSVYEEIYKDVLPKRAKLRCMNLLKSKDYTVMQLRQKLKAGFYPDEVIEEALDYVASFHYTDDLRYAKDFIFYHHTSKSKKRIDNDLLRKGIDKNVIEKAWMQWEEAGNEQDEEAQIQQLLEKKHFDPDTAEQKDFQRIYGFLLRRGFAMDKICKVLRK